MKFNYKFQNLLGTVYRKGDVLFSKDGNCVISPVGNKITIYNLKQNQSNTLCVESKYNYTAIDVSPNGSILLAINEKGEAQMISMLTCTVIHRYKFKTQVNAVKFSPDGKYFAACCDSTVFIMSAPLAFTGEFRSFVMKRVFKKAYDEVTCLDWSSCSKLLAVGSKDTTTKIYTVDYLDNISMYSMSGHTDKIIGVFFEKKSLDLITVSCNGQVCLWEASIDSDDLVTSSVQISHSKRRKILKEEYSEDDLSDKEPIEKDKEYASENEEYDEKPETKIENEKKLLYKKLGRHYIGDSIRNAHHRCKISAAQYHKQTKILVTGFTTGIFFLHEMPDVNLIHTLSISEHRISSIAISPQGDWIAFGCPNIGQLLVWEWQSEQYVMKQQGHSSDMTCLAYSPDGLYIVTGGYDGKVKVWNATTGFCFVTFNEHKSAVSSVVFSASKKFFVSASLDGTLRCCDLARYRNFRTLAAPAPVQFGCAALDASGELCAAAGLDDFRVYLWSVKFGKLLEVLGGHEAPVGGLAFGAGSRLAAAGWDRSVRLWDCVQAGAGSHVLQLASDALQVAFSPTGHQIAVSTLDGNISFFNASSLQQEGSIEGRHDLGAGRADSDLVTADTMLKTKAFTSICYSADGSCLLAGGNSKHVCLYSVKEAVLIKKYVITQNRSLDAVNDYINRRVVSSWGNMALVSQRGEAAAALPGVKVTDLAERATRPEVRVYCVRFSPSGDSFAVAASEGLLLYQHGGLSDLTFRPYRLQQSSTPHGVAAQLRQGAWAAALAAALQLADPALLRRVLDAVPPRHVALAARGVAAGAAGAQWAARLLAVLAAALLRARHLELLLLWLRALLDALLGAGRPPRAALLALERALTLHYSRLSRICDFNKYTIRCIKTVGELSPKLENERMEAESDRGSSGRGTCSDTD